MCDQPRFFVVGFLSKENVRKKRESLKFSKMFSPSTGRVEKKKTEDLSFGI